MCSRAFLVRWFLPLIVLWIFTFVAGAHEPTRSYLNLSIESSRISGRLDLPLRDVQSVVPLDVDTNGFLVFEKLQNRLPTVINYVNAHLKLNVDGAAIAICFTNSEPAVEAFADNNYLELPIEGQTPESPKTLDVTFRLFFETNSLHRGLLRLECDGRTQTAIFSPSQPTQKLQIGVTSPRRQFLMFLREGIWHIWTGYDHILFLLALLLPSVLHRGADGWSGVKNFHPACINVLKIVTAFTVAHSLTLTLAALQIVRLPPRLTESAIAASVALAALNNLWPVVRDRGWLVAFGFGLVHGFGFANALADLGISRGTLALPLLGFNLGVEIGQLAIVAIFLPPAYRLRGFPFYQRILVRFGSAIIVIVAGVWFAERAFNL